MARNQYQQLCLVTVMHKAQKELAKPFTSKEGNSVTHESANGNNVEWG